MCSTDNFLVIGAGLPRTGTSSLKVALEQLLSGRCYHMGEVFRNTSVTQCEIWHRALDGKTTVQEWRNFFNDLDYVASADFPAAFHYKILMEAFPNAKVVLTTRDSDTWRDSVLNTVYYAQETMRNFPTRFVIRWLWGRESHFRVADDVCWAVPEGSRDKIVPEGSGDKIGTEGFRDSMFSAVSKGDKEAKEFFRQWSAEVHRVVPAHRLLVFDVRDGWEPLCRFLDLPVPDEPFPRLNDAETMRRSVRRGKCLAYGIVLAVPVCIGLVLSWILQGLR